MKRLSDNNKLRRLSLLALLPLSAIQAQAQIMDWVEKEIRGYVDRQINSIANTTNNYLT